MDEMKLFLSRQATKKADITKAVEKYLCPLMEAHGFIYKDYSVDDVWAFEKQGAKSQQVSVDQPWENVLRLEFRISPTQRHRHLEIDAECFDACPVPKWMLGGYCCRNQQELELLVQFYAKIVEEYGFSLMETAISDPLDIVATDDMAKELFLNHQHYAKEFAISHGIHNWEPNHVIEVIASELLQLNLANWQEQNASMLIGAAAAYGTIFEKLGGNWNYEDGMKCTVQFERPDSPFPYTVWPLNTVFHFLHYGTEENANELLKMHLRNLKV